MNLRRLISMAHDLGGMTATSGCDAEIATLQYELGSLCKAEIHLKDLHKQKLIELQDSWDKLVSLRRHIAIFRSQIEETTIEDIHNQAYYLNNNSSNNNNNHINSSITGRSNIYTSLNQTNHNHNNHHHNNSTPQRNNNFNDTFLSTSDSHVNSANKQIQFHILRERLHVRDQLQKTVNDYEKKLDLLREDIRRYSSILMESANVIEIIIIIILIYLIILIYYFFISLFIRLLIECQEH